MNIREQHTQARCPVSEFGDSKTGQLAMQALVTAPGSRLVQRFEQIWQVLTKSPVKQAGVDAAPVERDDPATTTIFFLEGEAHLRRRAAIQGFFSPQAIAKRHHKVMTDNADLLVDEFCRVGEVRLDRLCARMASAVVAEIVGLTNSDLKGMSRRISGAFDGAMMAHRGGWRKLLSPYAAALNALQIFLFDVQPAIAQRRQSRSEDVISSLLDEGRSDKEILIECITFSLAGMTTTRELMIMSAWHMLENAELKEKFLSGDEQQQMAILKEILRLEPLASRLGRRTTGVIEDLGGESIPEDCPLTLDLRAANLDEKHVGACPHKLDPERARHNKINDNYLSFGAGSHLCPGRNVAIAEARTFLDRLLRVPGIRLVRAPDIHFLPPLLGTYELSNCVISCKAEG